MTEEAVMKIKKIAAGALAVALMILINYFVVIYQPDIADEYINLEVSMKAEESANPVVYYLLSVQSQGESFSEQQSVRGEYTETGRLQTVTFSIPAAVQYLRLDPCENGEEIEISDISLTYKGKEIYRRPFSLQNAISINEADQFVESGNIFSVREGSLDPNLVWDLETDEILSAIRQEASFKYIVIKLFLCVFIDVLFLVVWRKKRTVFEVPKEIIKNRKLIFSLAKNDFKTKFAGSYFGIIWAFIQPIVTVLVYWFVFDKALSAGAQTTRAGITVPFVLWLIAGLVPWFFFSEVLSMGTNALIEYSYLVKKVVFKISILPVVKIVSSLFVHMFFIAFMLILYSCYQYYPTAYTLQILYYSFCMIMLALGLVYATSAIVVFFRDLSQVINIVLQVGMWATPIMWNIDAMAGKVSPIILGLLKLNPLYYVVSGYRDSLISHVWFWDRPELTLYFWIFVVVVFLIGFTIFRRLQVHFADVL